MRAILPPDDETRLVRDFFGGVPGFFVDVGANDPQLGSQSWHLEQAGWTGILVEPAALPRRAIDANAQGEGFCRGVLRARERRQVDAALSRRTVVVLERNPDGRDPDSRSHGRGTGANP